jgi:hypothetical protein
MSWASEEKFIRQMVNKLMNEFKVKSSVLMWDSGVPERLAVC